MIIHCLSRLARRLGPLSEPSGAVHPLGGWHAQWHDAGLRSGIVFCHDLSRYVLYLNTPASLKPNHLAKRFVDLFLEVVACEGFETAVVARLARTLHPVEFDTRTDPSVMGSMSGIIRRLPQLVLHSPVQASLGLSHHPTRVHGQRIFPDKALAEMIQALQAGGRGH